MVLQLFPITVSAMMRMTDSCPCGVVTSPSLADSEPKTFRNHWLACLGMELMLKIFAWVTFSVMVNNWVG